MTSVIDTIDAIQRISIATSFDEAWSALSEGTEKLEIKLGSYAYGFPEEAIISDIQCHTLPLESEGVRKHNYTSDFLDFYDEGNFFQYDTTVLWGCAHERPALWTEIDRPVVNGALGGKFVELYHTARDFGMRNGAVIPLRKRAEAGIGGLVVVTDNELKSEQADRLLAERMPALQKLAEAFHLYRPISELSEAIFGLSKREKECLQYLCSGLSQKEIAYRFQTHDRTVQKQITSAKKKLNANTMTQAVVKALAYELIDL